MEIKKLSIDSIFEEKENAFDFKKTWEETFVDVKKEIKPQPIAISIGTHEYKGNHYKTPFGSYGDYSCIVGASKSRKTFLKSAIIAAYISGQITDFFDNINGHRYTDLAVVEFDTEQSEWHSQKVFKRVCEMAGGVYPHYYPFHLRGLEPKERLQFIDWVILEKDSPVYGNIGLVSIDGYVDLVTDFNNLEQSTNLQEKLLKWTSLGKCHITGVLHKNFGSEKPVGHVGSSVLKKAETIAFVEKKDDLTEVVCKYARNIDFEPFSFRINKDNWLPEKVHNISF